MLEAEWEKFLVAARGEIEKARQRDLKLFPHFTTQGKWSLLSVDQRSSWLDNGIYEHGNWTAGFSLGVEWLLAAVDRADATSSHPRFAFLADRCRDATTHDLGFLFYPSFAFPQQLGLVDTATALPALDAAAMLARRYSHRGGYIQAFGPVADPRSAGSSTIDTMMNLPLIWWAAAQGCDPSIYDIARQHARTSARLFLRNDGSTFHLISFDPDTGALAHRGTFQGASDDSCWSRGQSWATCGFAWAYAETREEEFLVAAERTATFFLDHLPQNGLPPWDFGAPSEAGPVDSSASAIMSLGLLILGEVHPSPSRREALRHAAADLLGRLGNHINDGSSDGILLRSCYSKPHNLGVDGATAWGDFYVGIALAVASGALDLSRMLDVTPSNSGRRAE